MNRVLGMYHIHDAKIDSANDVIHLDTTNMDGIDLKLDDRTRVLVPTIDLYYKLIGGPVIKDGIIDLDALDCILKDDDVNPDKYSYYNMNVYEIKEYIIDESSSLYRLYLENN